ncbi:uncharacterized protein LOC103048254 [Python bivittatus]|uniref:Uncharacterized protein LOC103048254 n=1 Tax=Python bivittatus TaxID=176946 RepID=A0A9F5IM45_PYTBI|nr:uncharacterized protein LOC103048254 [Python bivittatus]
MMAWVRKLVQSETVEEMAKMHFYRGICELMSVVSCLQQAKEDDCFYVELKEHIEKATKELGITENLVLQGLDKVDSTTSEILASKNKLVEEQKTKENELANLQSLHMAFKRLGEIQREEYLRQGAMKEEAEKAKAAAADDILEQEKLKVYGLVLMLIPLVGPVIGGIQILSAHMAQKTAEEQVAVAQVRIEDYSAKEQMALCEVSRCEKLLKEQENKIKVTQKSLRAMEDKKKKLANFLNEILKLQAALRFCAREVGDLHMKVKVVRVTNQYVFNYDSWKHQIDGIIQHLLRFLHAEDAEYHLLDSPKIKRGIRRLKFLSESPSTLARNIYALKDLLHDEIVSWYFIIGFVILAFLWTSDFFYKALLAIFIGFIFVAYLSL